MRGFAVPYVPKFTKVSRTPTIFAGRRGRLLWGGISTIAKSRWRLGATE